jgi:galactokinase
MNVFVCGNVPPRSGLSSSSSIVVGSMEACLFVNGMEMSDKDLVDAAHIAEWYVGTRGGGGDHAAIKFCRAGYVAHLGAFPLSVELIPFPRGYRVVLCNSMVVAAKTAGSRNLFNQRVACYELGMLILRKAFPQYATRMARLRDVNPTSLGVDEGQIYQMLKVLPEAASREELSAALADRSQELERIFRTHDPVPEGYRIRQACLYGIAECMRSEQVRELLPAGDIEGFGELINLSHDGDRVTRGIDGQRRPVAKPLPDAELDRLTVDTRNGDPTRRQRAHIYCQPGGYDASCPELDEMVDIVLDVPGVIGAGLVGAGLGGSVAVLAEKKRTDAVIAAVAEHYYHPRQLPVTTFVCTSVGGSGVFSGV